ncbi:unnamed protein product [Durusdinium trenchii]|uniref:DNA (cytosine-5-)-methyltransferase n=1 Tax=Durusdinium trenchii TaxID=1381693 RepID=A0ABP0PA64_9DINO
MAEGNLPTGHIHGDVKTYHPTSSAARRAGAIVGGFPCQGVSQAGAQAGLRDVRSSLVRELFRIYDESESVRMMFLENVQALLSLQKGCRDLFWYLVKVSAWMSRAFLNRGCVQVPL